MPARELSVRFEQLYTGAIADVLDGHGYDHQTLTSSIRPLRPHMRLAGPAFTIEGRSSPGCDHDSSIRGILAMLGQVPAGHVAVYQANDDGAAHLGELSVAALKVRGCRGAVLDGGIRDTDLMLQQEFPIFSRYATPQDGPGRWEVVSYGAPVRIGEVNVAAGDFVIADADGIVVVPAPLTETVLAEAEEVASTESAVRAAVLRGVDPLVAFERFGRF